MFNFKPVTISNRDMFNSYLNINKYPNSEYNFTTIFAWRKDFDFSYAIINDCLCIKNKNNTCFFPLGEEKNVAGAILSLCDYMSRNNASFKFGSLSDEMVDVLRNNGLLDRFEMRHERNFCDYIYKRESLVTLSGKKLHGKRNHYNYFINNYNFALTDIFDTAACEKKLKFLIDERSRDPKQEYIATIEAFRNREELGLIGKLLIVDDKIAGIILGERHHDAALVQIAKSDISYRGASVALFQLFFKDNLTECQSVNFMEDMGLEGLRKAKLSYNPIMILDKYSLAYKAPN